MSTDSEIARLQEEKEKADAELFHLREERRAAEHASFTLVETKVDKMAGQISEISSQMNLLVNKPRLCDLHARTLYGDPEHPEDPHRRGLVADMVIVKTQQKLVTWLIVTVSAAVIVLLVTQAYASLMHKPEATLSNYGVDIKSLPGSTVGAKTIRLPSVQNDPASQAGSPNE